MRMMTRASLAGAALAAGVLLVGCAPATPGTGGPTGTATVGSGPTSATPVPPATEPAPDAEYTVTYPFGVPSARVSISHPVHPPIGGPDDPPLPYLVGIYVGNHPEGQPPYQRISFYFRGAFPSYNFGYVDSVLTEAQGTPISLQGNSFLRVGFTDAQAHDNAGQSTIKAQPANPIGFQNLKSYGAAGDFEGHVSYGLGIQVASGSDQVLKIRAGELKKPDGSGGFFYVVHFDVQTA